jgi:hypothetical protein
MVGQKEHVIIGFVDFNNVTDIYQIGLVRPDKRGWDKKFLKLFNAARYNNGLMVG